MKTFKRKFAAIALSATLLVGLTACGKAPEDVVAKVNGEDIKKEDFVNEYAAMRNSYLVSQANGKVEALKEEVPNQEGKTVDQFLKDMALENLIKFKIIEEDAEKAGIKVTDKEVEELMNQDIQQIGGQEAFKEALAKQGLNENFYKTYLKRKLITSKYYEDQMKKFTPKDDEVKAYYDDHKDDYFTAKASHILVADEKEAKEIKKELDKGADFSKLAKEKSIEPSAKETGGSLGEFTNDKMVPEFSQAIGKMKVGEISDPVKTQFGYHIIKLEDKKARDFDSVKEEIKNKLLIDKSMEYNEKLEKDAKIKKYLDDKEEVKIPDDFKLETSANSSEKNNKDNKNNKDSKDNKKEEKKDNSKN